MSVARWLLAALLLLGTLPAEARKPNVLFLIVEAIQRYLEEHNLDGRHVSMPEEAGTL